MRAVTSIHPDGILMRYWGRVWFDKLIESQ